ncbi:MAG: hypothetical protein QM739_03750 [Propionivibrio sp.]
MTTIGFIPNSEKGRKYNKKALKNKLIFHHVPRQSKTCSTDFPDNTKLRATAILGATILNSCFILMSDPLYRADPIAAPTASSSALDTVLGWLDKQPAQLGATDELATLLNHLMILQRHPADHQRTLDALAGIYSRSIAHVEKLLPSLVALSLPMPRKLRLSIRGLQDLLRALAENLVSHSARITQEGQEERATALWRSMHALSLHLLLSNLAAAPASAGIWRLLHTTYERASKLGIASECPAGSSCSTGELYFAAILLACAQPAAFTSREISFVADYLSQHADLARLVDNPADVSDGSFWIDPMRDAAATPCSRRVAPENTAVIYFDCSRLAALIRKQLIELKSGILPSSLGLSDFAGTPAGRGALRRLTEFLGNPGKRRFPRRRQHYRAVLCAGLENLWNLFSKRADAKIETSSWMITNESPDGYSIMHVLGDSSEVSVGDVVAIRAETADKWQVCIARWAQSENQEHLEFGLQILATDAIPALLAVTAGNTQRHSQPVLILPHVPPLRVEDMLITPSGLLEEQPTRLVLVIEQGNIEIREVRNTRINEQNGLIEVFSIEPDEAMPRLTP